MLFLSIILEVLMEISSISMEPGMILKSSDIDDEKIKDLKLTSSLNKLCSTEAYTKLRNFPIFESEEVHAPILKSIIKVHGLEDNTLMEEVTMLAKGVDEALRKRCVKAAVHMCEGGDISR